MQTNKSRMPVADAIKAAASQLIVWHHLVFYGPMSDVVYPHATGPMDWLYNKARMAVQAFLVLGGFLAAQSLIPRFENGTVRVRELFWQRYVRLARPYLIALVAAVASGAVARSLMQHPANPSAPSLGQVIAHVFFLQDIAHEEALSAGVWYVAVDFQLYVLLVLLLWSARRFAAIARVRLSIVGMLMCTALASVSLLWLNRNPSLDVWAPYFFGAYGLGVFAQWISTRPRKLWWTVVLAFLVTVALGVEWRDRILVAGATALVLATCSGFAPRWAQIRWIGALGRISYSVFLIHYPVCLAVNSVVFRLWPQSAVLNALGMLVAWMLSLAAGALLYRVAECGRVMVWAKRFTRSLEHRKPFPEMDSARSLLGARSVATETVDPEPTLATSGPYRHSGRAAIGGMNL